MTAYLDTRDLLDELYELDARAEDEDNADPLDEDETERRTALRDLADEIGEQSMRDGDAGPLIPEDEWVAYAEELADDLGYTRNAEGQGWPMRHIDWQAAADELAYDYSTVTFDGTDYYYRMT